jgi:ferrous iron transport protein B
MPQKRLTIALAGNPNSGKTTIFNNITGTRQKVGNWPGVTVEKKEGSVTRYGYDLKIIDLPGTYSLTPFSIEEIIARDFILDENPDVVIDIIDASNLERSLYLATQLRELDCRVLFALNMADLARSRDTVIDGEKLSELLAVPVVFTVGNKDEGIDTLLKTAIDMVESGTIIPQKRRVKYSKDIEEAVTQLQQFTEVRADDTFPYNFRWTAIKLLEDDQVVKEKVLERVKDHSRDILHENEKLRQILINRFDDDPQIVMTDERYGFIAGIIKEVLTTSSRQRVDISRNIDLVLTNRFVGFPIFIIFIWAMFQLTFSLGEYPKAWIETGIYLLKASLNHSLPAGLLKELLVNGIVAGVGSVIVFLPNILVLFFCIAIFEDTGYMSRAAFLMDKIMHLIGLHGKSFIPMLMGFGCNVPAIMASRTLESEKDRILTILITPFMSCSAKLPVYIVLAGTFFAGRAGTVIFCIYLVGILLSIFTGRLFRSTLLKGEDAPFVMELPPYRVPMFKSLLIHMWDRSKLFLKKMGGIILVGSVVVWVLSVFPRTVDYSIDYAKEIEKIRIEQKLEGTGADPGQLSAEDDRHAAITGLLKAKKREETENSLLGRIGKGLSPVLSPIGLEWRGGVALLTGFVAKEIVVSTLGVLYAVEEDAPEALQNELRSSEMTPLSALAMMLFVLLYVPCLATVSTIRRETNSYRWAAFSVVYSTSIAWLVAFGTYQAGMMLGLG